MSAQQGSGMAQGEVGLGDLWQLGDERTFTAPEGTVTVWLQKLTPAEQDDVFKLARARRAVVLAAGRDKTSDTYLIAEQEAYETGDATTMIVYLTADELRKRTEHVEAELADAAEWSTDGYLAGMRDQWKAELAERWLQDPADAEASRVFAELERFNAQVNVRLEAVRSELASAWGGYTEEQLRVEVTNRLVKAAATDAFLNEYQRAEMWKGTRQAADHTVLHFASRKAVDGLSLEAFLELQMAFTELNRTVMAGKDSPASPASSPSSEPSDEAETPASSGLAAVSQ